MMRMKVAAKDNQQIEGLIETSVNVKKSCLKSPASRKVPGLFMNK
jgi:hypothetical protein